MTETDYMVERRLAGLDADLHARYRNCVVVSQQMLLRYEGIFPDFTDHTALHALEVVDYCTALIAEQIDRLSADELYVLLMSAMFHDVGLGVSGRDFEEFLPLVCPGEALPDTVEKRQKVVRANHQEFSGCYLRKYWEVFDIPNERYAQAIIQTCRGHRKADLWDPAGYPCPLEVLPERAVCLPYLAALLRLADELDIAFDRNFSFLYDPEHMVHAKDRFEFKKHRSIRRVELLADRVVVTAVADDAEIRVGIEETVEKLRKTLLYCREVTAARTDFVIHQSKVELDLTTV